MLGKGGRPCQGAGMREKAIQIIEKLTAAGYTALLAGGCVRDMLLGREAKDFDVATSATPEQVVRLFPGSKTVGAHFGVVVVRAGDHGFVEVATFRSDGSYSDGRRRHPGHPAAPRRRGRGRGVPRPVRRAGGSAGR